MHVETFRKETTKKNIGLTALPTPNNPVTIAKGLEAIDFVGMIVSVEGGYLAITTAIVTNGVIRFAVGQVYYDYNPSTGELSTMT